MIIWKEILERLNQKIPDDLWPFKSNASAIEDCIADTEECGSDHTKTMQYCEKNNRCGEKYTKPYKIMQSSEHRYMRSLIVNYQTKRGNYEKRSM
jgi:hypothetical protein